MSDYQMPEQSQLGKKSDYETAYNPSLLFPIHRQARRDAIGLNAKQGLPFYGYDIWNHYEVSWLNPKGKPIVALAEIIYACDSHSIIESKSMKLYFNSFNNTVIESVDYLQTMIERDIHERIGGSFIRVCVIPLTLLKEETLLSRFPGIHLDNLDVNCDIYHNDPALLQVEDEIVEETLTSDLLKANCLVTNQPDWYSVQIHYKGRKINHESLLKYLVSYRNDNEFHEPGIEKIFMHLKSLSSPEKLTIIGRSARRGGVDVNACRSSDPINIDAMLKTRLCRQ